jgi:RNA polymerase sigma factor (sigma-70 family)
MQQVTNHPQIDALLKGDAKTMRFIYDSIFPKVKYFIFKNNGSEEDAEEIFHNGLYQLIVRAKIKGIQINTTFEGYVFTVCKNLWYKELNKRKKEVRNDGVFELKSEDDDHVASIMHQERWDLFEEMLLKPSSNCQKLLKDYFNKVSYDEIIKKFNYATKNVAFQRIFKCKKRLTDLIKLDTRYKKL